MSAVRSAVLTSARAIRPGCRRAVEYGRRGQRVRAVDGVDLGVGARRDRRAGRRVRLRQVVAGPRRRRPGAARRRHGHLRGARPSAVLGRRRRPDQLARAADGLPGPLRVAQPAPQGRRAHRRRGSGSAAAAASDGLQRAAELLERVGMPADRGRQLPARVQRRPAAADRDRPDAGGRAVVPDRRRAASAPWTPRRRPRSPTCSASWSATPASACSWSPTTCRSSARSPTGSR